MANALYDKAKESFLSQNPSIDLDTDTIKLIALTQAETFTSTDQYLSAISANRYTGTTDQTFANKTVTDGTFDNTADLTFASLSQNATDTIDAFVIYKDTGSAATSPLICWIDTDGGGAISITPNGGDVIFSPNASGIFAL